MTTTEKLRAIVLDLNRKLKKKNLTAETLTDTTRLAEELGFDSLDMAELLVLVEEAFKIKIDFADGRNLTNIKDAAAYIDSKLAG